LHTIGVFDPQAVGGWDYQWPGDSVSLATPKCNWYIKCLLLLPMYLYTRGNSLEKRAKQNRPIIQYPYELDLISPELNSSLKFKMRAMGLVEQFNEYRGKMNEKILAADNLIIKRIFNLDTNAYQEGALDVRSKELIGLTCSLVLRCDDCVKYHLGKCKEVGLSTAEVHEAMGVATLIGGTIVIPHLRRAFEYWEALAAQ
jgi:AhpD family alkylhydroperoxidase